jgi:hypothetical protein
MMELLLRLAERMGVSSVMRKDLSQYGSVWVRRLDVSDYVTKQKEASGLTWLTVHRFLGILLYVCCVLASSGRRSLSAILLQPLGCNVHQSQCKRKCSASACGE